MKRSMFTAELHTNLSKFHAPIKMEIMEDFFLDLTYFEEETLTFMESKFKNMVLFDNQAVIMMKVISSETSSPLLAGNKLY